ncbi:hypothetical protein J6590_028124 [Homalodisca vitripennis]|nr:hypothetical protein J6590_028124 [Homalodisca vitripennis]
MNSLVSNVRGYERSDCVLTLPKCDEGGGRGHNKDGGRKHWLSSFLLTPTASLNNGLLFQTTMVTMTSQNRSYCKLKSHSYLFILIRVLITPTTSSNGNDSSSHKEW